MRRHLCHFAVVLLLSAAAVAGSTSAVVQGSVYDAAGKAAAGVTVTLENLTLGFRRATISDRDGFYQFSSVPPAGGYRATAIKDGERWDVRYGILVSVGDVRTIIPPLRRQAVAVATSGGHSAGQGITTDAVSISVSGVIAPEQLRMLPLLNRNFLALGLLTPNTHDVPAGSPLSGAAFSISGARPENSNFLLDGAPNVASSTNQALPFQVNDSIQEFRVVSSAPDVEFGRTLGGVVTVVTRRGSNAFHGSVFGYFASDALGASSPVSVYNGTTFDRAAAYAGDPHSTYTGLYPLTYNDYVASAQNLGYCTNSITATSGTHSCSGGANPRTEFGENTRFDPAALLATNDSHMAPFQSQQFGAHAGGAVVRDKMFLFGSYEGTLINNPNPIFERVPSQFDRAYDPLSAAPGFLANDPNWLFAQRVLSLFPQPNVVGVPGVLEFFRGEAPNYTHVHNGLLRADLVRSHGSSLSAHYAVQRLDQLHDDSLPRQAQYAGNGALRDARNQNLALTYTRAFTSRTTNEARASYNRFALGESPQDNGASALNLLGLPFDTLPSFLLNGIDPRYSGAVPGYGGAFNLAHPSSFSFAPPALNYTLDSRFPFARIGAPFTAPTETRDSTVALGDTVSALRGRHNLRLGAEVQRLGNRFTDGSLARGVVYSANLGEFVADSAYQGEFARPSFDFARKDQARYAGDFRWWALSGFVQDTWRLRARLTATIGLRYDFFSVPRELHDAIWNYDPQARGLVQQGHSTVVDPYGQPCSPGAIFSYPGYVAAADSLRVSKDVACASSGSAATLRSETQNLAPRLGVAWDIFGTGRTVVHLGAGLYYAPIPVRGLEQLLYNRPVSTANTIVAGPEFVTNYDLPNNCAVSAFGNSMLAPSVMSSTSMNGGNPYSHFVSTTQPGGMYAIDHRNGGVPNSRQINVSIQQQIAPQFVGEVAYVGNFARNLPVVYDQNFGTEFDYADRPSFSPFGSFGDEWFLFPVLTMADAGSSSYHSLMLRVSSGQWRGLRVSASYAFSKSIDNVASSTFPTIPFTANNILLGLETKSLAAQCFLFASRCGVALGGGGLYGLGAVDFTTPALTTTGERIPQTTPYTLPQNPFNPLKDDRGRSDFDVNHRLVLNYIWDIPAPRRSGWLHALAGSWSTSGVILAQTGQPFTVFVGPVLGEITQRANSTGPVRVSRDPAKAIDATNLALPNCALSSNDGQKAFVVAPGQACTGATARNQFTGPGLFNVDGALQKIIRVGANESRALIFRVEAFNLFNHANFSNPVSVLSTDGFNLNPEFGKIKSAHIPRQLQLAMRFSW